MPFRPFFAFGSITLALLLTAAPSRDGRDDNREPRRNDTTLAAYRWRSIGPVLEGGRINAMAVVPPKPGHNRRQDRVMYVAAGTGGIWKTVNAGLTWAPIFDDQATQAINDIAVAPSDPGVIWVGTGDGIGYGTRGRGVYRSTDGGVTWQNKGFAKSGAVTWVAIHPTDARTVLIAVSPADSTSNEYGVYRTHDGGETWARVISDERSVVHHEGGFDPLNPGVVYVSLSRSFSAAADQPVKGNGPGLYKSLDGGATWQRLTSISDRRQDPSISITVSPAQNGLLYASVAGGSPSSFFAPAREPKASGIPDTSYGTYRSTDGGATWEWRGNESKQRMIPHPRDPNQLFVASRGVEQSYDAGKTFVQLSGFEGTRVKNDMHVDPHTVWIDPEDDEHWVSGSDAGLWFTHDGGRNWSTLENLPIGQFYTVATDMRQPYHVYGGTQDNSMFGIPSRSRLNIGITNRDVFDYGGGDTFYAAADPVDTNLVYLEVLIPRGVIKVNHRSGEVRSAGVLGGGQIGGTDPLIVSQHDHRTLYTGNEVVRRSRDEGDTWEIFSDSLGGPASDSVVVDNKKQPRRRSSLGAIAESPLSADIVWAGAKDGSISVTKDGGKTWSVTVNLPGVKYGVAITSVAASAHDPEVAYAVASAATSGDLKPYVFRTNDGGKTWAPIASDLPADAGSWVIVEHPRQPKLLFVGTEEGAYFSVDGGWHWRPLNNGLPAVRTWAMTIQGRENDLVIATWGRGMYILDDLSGLEGLAEAERAARPALMPVRRAIEFTERLIFFSFPSAHQGLFPNPPYGATINYYLPAGTKAGSVALAILDSSGAVIQNLDASESPGLQRAVWNLRIPPLPPIAPTPEFTQGLAPIPGVLVAPGTYRARLTVAGSAPLETPIVVVPDPAGEQDPQVLAKLHADRMALRHAVARNTAVGQAAVATRLVVDEAVAAVKAAKASPELTALADSIKQYADSLLGSAEKGSLLESLNDVLSRSTQPYSAAQRGELASVEQQLDLIAVKLEEFVAGRLAALQAAMDQAGIPWSRGRKLTGGGRGCD